MKLYNNKWKLLIFIATLSIVTGSAGTITAPEAAIANEVW